eukprot:511047-Amphidinium_carterae.1
MFHKALGSETMPSLEDRVLPRMWSESAVGQFSPIARLQRCRIGLARLPVDKILLHKIPAVVGLSALQCKDGTIDYDEFKAYLLRESVDGTEDTSDESLTDVLQRLAPIIGRPRAIH